MAGDRNVPRRIRKNHRFSVGPMAHLLKNRFYLGEVMYRGEVHAGEHEPILDRELFEAVQAKRAANAVARKVRLRGSASILAGRIFDDRGNRMSSTHSNKLGVRYRYYVSHALLQNRKEEADSVARVPAPEVERLVLDGVRTHLLSTQLSISAPDRDLCHSTSRKRRRYEGRANYHSPLTLIAVPEARAGWVKGGGADHATSVPASHPNFG